MTIIEQRLEISKSILHYYISSGKIPINSSDDYIDDYVSFSVKITDKLITELINSTEDESTTIIDEQFERYKIGRDEVDRIMQLPYNSSIKIDIKNELLKNSIKIDSDFKLEYYSYLSTLFLNELLNRLNTYKFIEEAENRALEARESIGDIIQDLRKE